MKEKLISIIIPVYQAEKTIGRTIESVIQCPSNAIELILINDGSKDHSLQICQDYAQKDDRIRVLNQKNSGVSAARNNGISHAVGKYIFFLDADDEMENGEELLRQAKQARYDLIAFAYKSLFPDGTTKEELFEEASSSADTVKRVLFGTDLLNPCWGKLFRRSVINQAGITFPHGISIGEDYIFVIEYIAHAQTFRLDNTIAVIYLQNSEGIVRSLNLEKRIDGLYAVWKCCLQHTHTAENQKYQDAMYVQQFMTMMYSMRLCAECTSGSQHMIQQLMNSQLKQELMAILNPEKLSGHRKIEYFLVKHNHSRLLCWYLKSKAAIKRKKDGGF